MPAPPTKYIDLSLFVLFIIVSKFPTLTYAVSIVTGVIIIILFDHCALACYWLFCVFGDFISSFCILSIYAQCFRPCANTGILEFVETINGSTSQIYEVL